MFKLKNIVNYFIKGGLMMVLLIAFLTIFAIMLDVITDSIVFSLAVLLFVLGSLALGYLTSKDFGV